ERRVARAASQRLGLPAAGADAGVLGRLSRLAQAAARERRAGAEGNPPAQPAAVRLRAEEKSARRSDANNCRQVARGERVRDAPIFREMIARCRATASVFSIASLRSASRTALRSAGWSMVARPGSN